MVVPQFPPPVLGGLERQALILSRALIDRGVSVEVISGSTRGSVRVAGDTGRPTVHRVPLPLRRPARAMTTVPSVAFWTLVNAKRFDIVHLHNVCGFSMTAYLAARLAHKKTVIKIPTTAERALRGLWCGRVALRNCDRVVSLVHDNQAHLIANGIAERKIIRIPNGVEVENEPQARRVDVESPVRVAFIGRLAKEKNIPNLLYAWAELIKNYDVHAVLTLVGDGNEKKEIEIAIRQLELHQVVDLVGYQENVRKILEKTDVFVLPSLVEGNSNALLEAMAMGIPVVASRVGGTPALVGAEGEPFLFSPTDIPGIIRTLLPVLTEPLIRRDLGISLWDRARSQFSIQKIAQRYHMLYNEICNFS